MLMKNSRIVSSMRNLLFLSAFFIAGCSTDSYRAETELHSDGSVDRAVYQPVPATREQAQNPSLWKKVTWAGQISPDTWEGSIRDLPIEQKADEIHSFAAWNRFPSVDRIPDYYMKSMPDGAREAVLEREYQKNDYVFVAEHEWSEVLTDTFDLKDMYKARRELADIIIPILEEALSDALGDEYEVTGLIASIQKEGFQWFSELTDATYEIAARRRAIPKSQLELVFEKRIIEICRQHGLNLSGDGQKNKKIIAEFISGKLKENIKRKNGKPIEEHAVKMVLESIFGESGEEQARKNPLQASLKKAIIRKYGDEEKFKELLALFWSRHFGVHNDFLSSPIQFHYSLKVPGIVIESSGAILSASKVEWVFDPSEAFPLGYSMTCRSLEPVVDSQQKLLGRSLLTSREKMIQFTKLVSGDAELLKALQTCRLEGNLAHLKKYRKTIESEPTPFLGGNKKAKAISRLMQLRKILELKATE